MKGVYILFIILLSTGVMPFFNRRLKGDIGYCAKDCIKKGGGPAAVKACEAKCPKHRRMGAAWRDKNGKVHVTPPPEEPVLHKHRRMNGDIGYCAKECIKKGGGPSAVKACEAKC